jgi:sugar phosphate isomerase/epimerase
MLQLAVTGRFVIVGPPGGRRRVVLTIKIGVQLASLRLAFKKALPRVAQMGATAVEIDARGELKPREITRTGLRQIRKWLDDYGLKVCAVGFRTRRGYDVVQDLQPRIEATKEALQFAYDLGCSVVVNQVGQVPIAEDSPSAWSTLTDSLAEIGRFSQQVGAWLAMETGTESGEEMARLLQALPQGSAMVSFDPGNLIINGYSPLEAVRVLGAHIVHVHAKDAVRDLAQGRGLEVPLGRGSADFPALLAALEEHQYRGYFTVERQHSPQAEEEIGLAVQYLRNI